MASREVTFSNLIGPGVSPTDECTVSIEPAYAIEVGESINWDVAISTDLPGGVGSITVPETTWDGTPVPYRFRIEFKNQRGQVLGSFTSTRTVPDGSGPINFKDCPKTDVVAPPEYGPTWAQQAEAAAASATAAALRAEAAAASALGIAVETDPDGTTVLVLTGNPGVDFETDPDGTPVLVIGV